MFYTYVLMSREGDLYVGSTSDLKRRLEEHNQKLNFSTKTGSGWKVIYYEATIDKIDATRREKYLKTTQGKRMLKLRLKEYFYNRRI